jgi:hypothetical protein
MQKLSRIEYISAMRRIEGQQNAARRSGAPDALKALVLRAADLNRRFWQRGQA